MTDLRRPPTRVDLHGSSRATPTSTAAVGPTIRNDAPDLSVLSPDLIERILDESLRVLAEVGIEIRGPEMRRRLLEAGLPTTPRGPGAFPARGRRGGHRLRADGRSGSTTVTATRTPTSAGTASTSCRARRGLKRLDHRTGEARLADSTDFVEYVRLGDGLEHIPYLATAFSTNDDIEPQVSDAWRLYLA